MSQPNQIEHLKALLQRLESETGAGRTSCVTFGLPSSQISQGTGMLRQEIAEATNIRSRV